jgi:hypothetical protein
MLFGLRESLFGCTASIWIDAGEKSCLRESDYNFEKEIIKSL